jgi:hypothetical protein
LDFNALSAAAYCRRFGAFIRNVDILPPIPAGVRNCAPVGSVSFLRSLSGYL